MLGILFIMLAIGFVFSQGGVVQVDGDSMLPTYKDEDRVIIFKLFYTPKNGDVVVVELADFENLMIKRIIGVAGDVIEIDPDDTGSGIIYRNGNPLTVTESGGLLYEEDYTINERTYNKKDLTGAVTVPQGFVFILGDNRGDSKDSRNKSVGMVHTSRIVGKAIHTISN